MEIDAWSISIAISHEARALFKPDLKNYRDILLRTNAHKRKYQNSSQVKRSKSFKYQHIIKNLFKPKTHLIGKGLLTTTATTTKTKSYSKDNRGYKYWDDPNELIERLRLLLASESAGNTNHKNEIVSKFRRN